MVLGSASPSRADPVAATGRVPIPHVPIGFSKLIVRIEGQDDFGIARAEYPIRFVERMRAAGFEAVGAENLVFDKDDSARAEYLLGGTVREVECKQKTRSVSCRAGIDWQVLAVAEDKVVYQVTTRAVVLDTPNSKKERVAGILLDRAMDSLLARDGFRRSLAGYDRPSDTPTSPFPAATIAKCAPGRKVSESAEDLLKNIVVIKEGDHFGSGFFVTADGLVVTAAHVVKGSAVTLRFRDGTEASAVPVRVAPREDVALLRLAHTPPGQTCAAIRTDTPPSGAEVYAAGAPASLELAFSLTRGIVSGYPVIEGHRRLQTDASVSPGNSGGPIVDDSGAVLGVVSFKIVATHVEGVAFAVPMAEALAALGLRTGDATDPGLLSGPASPIPPETTAVVKDRADPIPSLDPAADWEQVLVEMEKDRDQRTPFYVPLLRWGGAALAVVGALTTLVTDESYHASNASEREFHTLRLWNTLGWAATGVGIGSFVVSFPLQPPLRPLLHPAAASSMGIGPGGVVWKETF